MTVKPFDSVIRPSDEFSRRIARNIQIMMQSEFNFLQPVDPAGGSWYIESLTDEFAEKVWAKMQEIEKEGGIIACLENGKVQAAVKAVLDDRLKKLATRADRAVGNNMYPNVTEVPMEVPEAEFVTSFMQVANFEVMPNDGFPTVEEAVEAAIASKADVTIVCSGSSAGG